MTLFIRSTINKAKDSIELKLYKSWALTYSFTSLPQLWPSSYSATSSGSRNCWVEKDNAQIYSKTIQIGLQKGPGAKSNYIILFSLGNIYFPSMRASSSRVKATENSTNFCFTTSSRPFWFWPHFWATWWLWVWWSSSFMISAIWS